MKLKTFSGTISSWRSTKHLRLIEIKTNSGIPNEWELQEEFVCLENGDTEWEPIPKYGLYHNEHPRNQKEAIL